MSTYTGPGVFTINRSSNDTYNCKSPPTQFPTLPPLQYPLIGGGGYINLSIQELWTELEKPDVDNQVSLQHLLRGDSLQQIPLLGNIRNQTIGSSKWVEQLYANNQDLECKRWLLNHRSYIAENELLDDMRKNLGENGLILHNYDTKTYLGLLTESLPVQDSILNGLDNQWDKIARLKGINEAEIKVSDECIYTSKVFSSFISRDLAQGTKPHSPDVLKSLVERYPRCQADKDRLRHTRKMSEMILSNWNCFQGDPTRSFDMVKNVFNLSELMIVGREVDFLLVIPSRKLILQLEMKYLHEVKKSSDIRRRYNDAKVQIKKMHEWLETNHGDIFGGWKYVGAVSLPTVGVHSPFLASFSVSETEFMLLSGVSIKTWFTDICRNHNVLSTNCPDADASYRDFIKRTIGLSGFTNDLRKDTYLSAQEVKRVVVGDHAQSIQPGCSPNDVFTTETTALSINKLRLDDKPEAEKSSLKVLLWSSKQREIIEHFPDKVFLLADFGTGKTLLLKTGAIKSASTSKCYYVALNSTVTTTLFDVSTKHMFERSGVEFRNSGDLYIECDDDDTKAAFMKDLDTLHLLKWLVAREPSASYFVDEYSPGIRMDDIKSISHHGHTLKQSSCGHGQYNCKQCGEAWEERDDELPYACSQCIYHLCVQCARDELSIERMMEIFKISRGKLWIAVRGGMWSENYVTRCRDTSKNKIVLCELPIVARCTGHITKCANNFGSTYHSGIEGKPADTVDGLTPRVTLIKDADECLVVVMKHIIMESGSTFVVVTPHNDLDEFEVINKKIFNSVQNAMEEYNVPVIKHDKRNLEPSRKYMSSPRGVILMDKDGISGMEANVVVCVDNKFNLFQHRDVMMRTVSTFYYVAINDQEGYDRLLEAGFKSFTCEKVQRNTKQTNHNYCVLL